MRFLTRAHSWILFLFALSFTFFAVQSGDLLLYLAFARDFILNWEWPPFDPYIYSLQAPLQISHEYLSFVLFHGVHHLGGMGALIIFKMFILSSIFVLVLRAGPRGANREPLWILLWTLAVFAASFRFIERSSLFSDLFCVGLVFYLSQTKQLTWKLIGSLSLLFLVWVQLHPGYPLGLCLIGVWAIGQLIWNPELNRRQLWRLLLPPLALFINPHGLEGALYPFRFALNEAQVLKNHNLEWFQTYHPTFRFTPEVLAFWVLLAFTTLLFLRRRLWRSVNGLLFLFSAGVAIQVVRFVPWASFAILVLVKPWADGPTLWRPHLQSALLVLLTLVGTSNFINGYSSSSGKRIPKLQLDPKFFPIKTTEFLRTHPIPGQLYNSHDLGAYLIFSKTLPIFHHGFVTDMNFYSAEVAGVFASQARFLELATKHNWTKLLIDKNSSYAYFHKILSPLPEWRIVSEDEAAYLIYRFPPAL